VDNVIAAEASNNEFIEFHICFSNVLSALLEGFIIFL